MKKIILSLLVAFTLVVSLPQLFAAEKATGDLVIHFKVWDGDYTDLGVHGWDGINGQPEFTGTDDFGVYLEVDDIEVVAADSTAVMGFIAVRYKEETVDGVIKYTQDWTKKLTDDILIKKSIVKAGETVHVYIFQGNAKSTADEPRYFVADNTKFNMLLTYFDPSGSYEKNLGVHHWNGWNLPGADWNAPVKIFTTAGNTSTGMAVKAAMLTADDIAKDPGLLIYFGEGDGSKKTGDVKLVPSLGTKTAVGSVGFTYVYSGTNGDTAGKNVFYTNEKYETFYEEGFSLRLLPFAQSETNGAPTGTYAVRETQIIAKLSANIANPLMAEGAVESEAMAKMLGYWSVVPMTEGVAGTPLTIERIDFAQKNASIADFVIVLAEASKLDITKNYVLKFNDTVNQAEIAVDIDKEGPSITFPLLPANKIIEVAWGKAFNLSDFPLYMATDARDGDVTLKVYVPKGTQAKLDTRVEGDYVIALSVEDAWGNVTTETFTFRVVKK